MYKHTPLTEDQKDAVRKSVGAAHLPVVAYDGSFPTHAEATHVCVSHAELRKMFGRAPVGTWSGDRRPA